MIEITLQEIRKEKEKLEQEKILRKEKLEKEWRKKVENKLRKENEKKEKLEKQKLLTQHWEMAKWITDFINRNQETWEIEKQEAEKLANKDLLEWDKARRLDKIRMLKEKWRKNNDKNNKLDKEIEKTTTTNIEEDKR